MQIEQEPKRNKSVNVLLAASKELLSMWMSSCPETTNLTPHEIRNTAASRRAELAETGLNGFENSFTRTVLGKYQHRSSSVQGLAAPSITDVSSLSPCRSVNVANHSTSKICSMSSSHLYRSPSSCSITTPNGSLETHEHVTTIPALFQPNSAVKFHLGPQLTQSKISATASTSNTGNFPGVYEPRETPPPVVPVSPLLHALQKQYRGELSILEKYRYDLSRAQLKASSRTSALLAGFAMVALVELQYERTTPPFLLITLGVVTTLLVSVHLLALMMSTCILPYIEANGCTQDSPHIRLKFYIDLSWLFSTCIGLMLFLIEIGVIFFVKFHGVNYITAAYITTAMLVPVVIIFTIFSCLIHKNRFIHSMDRVGTKVNDLQKFLNENDPAVATNLSNTTPVQRTLVGAGLEGVKVIDQC